MWTARIPTILALLIWGYFALRGFDAMADIGAQGAPGYPNAEQRRLYLYLPLAMAGLSLLLFAASFRPRLVAAAGCLATLVLIAVFPLLFVYGGGV
jgi:hypothetical protein